MQPPTTSSPAQRRNNSRRRYQNTARFTFTPRHRSKIPPAVFGSLGGSWLIPAAGALLTVIFVVFSFFKPGFVTSLEGRFFDALIAADRPRPALPGPVVVALDDESLGRYGRWPWPRARVAELLRRIADQHPASVAVDIIFAEPEAAPPVTAPAGGGAGSRTVSAAAPTPSPAGPGSLSFGDLALERALAAGPFVLGYELTFAGRAGRAQLDGLRHPLKLAALTGQGASDPLDGFWQATGTIASRPEFSGRAAGSGFVNAAMEGDGVLRRMPLLIRAGERLYPSLALAAVLAVDPGGQTLLFSNWYGGRTLRLGKTSIPLDERGRLLLRYRSWHSRGEPVSAAALLDGRVPPDALKGRVVLLGATATGMGEAVTTPVQVAPRLSGVQVHAIAAENMLNGDFARNAPWFLLPWATLMLGALATACCARLPVLRGALVIACAALLVRFGCTWLFHRRGIFLPPNLPLLALLVNFSLLSPVRLLLGEARERRHATEIAQAREFIMTSLAGLTEIRDTETGAHILRTQRYLKLLCLELTRYPRFKGVLDPETIELLAKLAPLHDIGKVGLPDHLLHKASPFTPEEYEEVKKHATYGRDTILRAQQRSGLEDDELLGFAKDLAYSHHERWDGSGYPEGLKGEEIPWAGRVMAVADTYDALISRRVYKEPIPHDTAVRIIMQGKGTLFDPEVVDAFLRVQNQWWQIACELIDPDDEPKKLVL